MLLSQILFYTLCVITAISALGVVVTQNIVRAATWLLFTLAGVAGIFFLLGADFLGATQLIVYVGGTLVLVVFGVMLTAQGPFINMRIGAAEWAIAMAVGLLFFAVLAISLFKVEAPTVKHAVAPGEEGKPPSMAASIVLGQSLLGREDATPKAKVTGTQRARTPIAYLLPFEIVSVHLLVVLIGAAYLARAKRRRGVAS